MKTIARAMVVAALAAGSLGFSMSGPAAAAPPVTALNVSAPPVSASDVWYVAATYPNSPQGWASCGNAALNLYKGHCKIDSDNTSIVNLWASRG